MEQNQAQPPPSHSSQRQGYMDIKQKATPIRGDCSHRKSCGGQELTFCMQAEGGAAWMLQEAWRAHQDLSSSDGRGSSFQADGITCAETRWQEGWSEVGVQSDK